MVVGIIQFLLLLYFLYLFLTSSHKYIDLGSFLKYTYCIYIQYTHMYMCICKYIYCTYIHTICVCLCVERQKWQNKTHNTKQKKVKVYMYIHNLTILICNFNEFWGLKVVIRDLWVCVYLSLYIDRYRHAVYRYSYPYMYVRIYVNIYF